MSPLLDISKTPRFTISPPWVRVMLAPICSVSALSMPATVIPDDSVTTRDVSGLASSMQTVSVPTGTRVTAVPSSRQLAAVSHAPSAPIQRIVHGPSAAEPVAAGSTNIDRMSPIAVAITGQRKSCRIVVPVPPRYAHMGARGGDSTRRA